MSWIPLSEDESGKQIQSELAEDYGWDKLRPAIDLLGLTFDEFEESWFRFIYLSGKLESRNVKELLFDGIQLPTTSYEKAWNDVEEQMIGKIQKRINRAKKRLELALKEDQFDKVNQITSELIGQ